MSSPAQPFTASEHAAAAQPMDARYFQLLCENFGFALIATDEQLHIRFWNAAAERTLGARAEAVIGQPVVSVFPEPVRALAEQRLTAALRDGAFTEFEFEQRNKDGGLALWVAVISPILDSGGARRGLSVGVRDITERRAATWQKARSQRMEALGKMAGGVAHHFNSILGGVTTKLDFLLSTMHPRDKLRRDLEQLAEAIGRAGRISGQLMTFAEGEHEAGFPRELADVLADFVRIERPRLEQLGIRLVSELQPIRATQVESKRLQAVLDSLAHNAVDAMKDGGVLTVSLREECDSALVTVGDTGVGIPAEKMDRMFEPFFTTKGELGGGAGKNTGLSLSVVHSFLADMGGRIEVTSELGKGTTFHIRLPLGTRDAAKRRGM